MQRRYLVGLLLALAIALTACSNFSQSRSSHHAHSHFSDPKSTTERFDLEVKDADDITKLRLQLEVDEGKMSWILKDPDAEVQWEDEVGAGDDMDEERRFEPIPGDWTLEIVIEDAAGSYDVEWSSES
jgi:major membrane immunogen (membrane-anchored lipoprotein)